MLTYSLDKIQDYVHPIYDYTYCEGKEEEAK